jgi:agmatinase
LADPSKGQPSAISAKADLLMSSAKERPAAGKGRTPAVVATAQNISRPHGPVTVNRGAEMDWSGIQTFMKAPVCLTPEDLRAGGVDVAVGGAPWDGTASGLSGTRFGPRAIRQGDYITGSRSINHLNVRVNPLDHLVLADYVDAETLIGNPDVTFGNIRSFVAEILDGGAIPLILGGDHGITWPDATAVADAYGYRTVGIVHFDAHADTAPGMPGALHGHGTRCGASSRAERSRRAISCRWVCVATGRSPPS